MHQMPDDWQKRMAELLEEWDDTWDTHDMPTPIVNALEGNRFTSWPRYVLNYRHPDVGAIRYHRVPDHE